jgi:hypothetical protein
MPCFYYSPHANASTKPENVLFMEAELGAHVLRMCPLQWQDQYNMNKKGMTPMDMHSLLTPLEAIERICTYKKGKLESSEKSSHKSKKGKKCPSTDSTVRVPKKVHFEKHCNLCKKYGGTYLSYSMWLPSELDMCTNFEDTLGYMVSCRILRNIHVPCLQAKDHFYI